MIVYRSKNQQVTTTHPSNLTFRGIFKQIKMKFRDRTGEKHITKEGYEIEVIEYVCCFNCTVKFNDKLNTTLKNVQYVTVKNKTITNPHHPKIFGVGYLGIGIYNTVKNCYAYERWYGVMKRCYSEKSRVRFPTYKDVTVCEEWHSFQNFTKWHEENWKPYMDSSWHIDKGILVKGNKVYSPETCCFVPQEINVLFLKRKSVENKLPTGVNVNRGRGKKYVFSFSKNNENMSKLVGSIEEGFDMYKTVKEEWIKEVADKWKNLILSQVYKAMYNYKVEIID